MRVAVIPPTPHLDLSIYQGNTYHLALAQRVLTDIDYRDFYAERSRLGDFVILDNGACELGESLKLSDLIEAIRLIKPTQVVLPDKLLDKNKTIELTDKFLNLILEEYNSKLSFMAVVQGKNRNEWLECYKYFASNQRIHTIGISNTNAMYPYASNYFSRVQTINYLHKNKLINPRQNIHLLGLGDSGHIELEQLGKYDFIEGVDSSAPIVHGFNNVLFKPNHRYQKIRSYLKEQQIIPSSQLKIVKQNISLLMEITNAGGLE